LKESVSIVVPVYEEAESLPELYSSLKGVMDGLDIPYEIIFVDDGSKDSSLEILEGIQARDDKVVVLSFRRNFGQTAALAAGFDYAKGDVVVTMDADLQNDPADIPGLLEKIKDYDVVSGWRKDRKDPFFSRKLPSIIANWLISEEHQTLWRYAQVYPCNRKLGGGNNYRGRDSTQAKTLRPIQVRHIKDPEGHSRPNNCKIPPEFFNPSHPCLWPCGAFAGRGGVYNIPLLKL
jgi:glycosyltransferase involved in cell wall biosynthesis